MFARNKKLKTKVWIYLTFFSIFILAFLWIFQVFFLDSYYEWSKTKEILNLSNKIKNNYNSNEFTYILDELSFKEDICIEVNDNKNLIYASSGRKNCMDEMHDPKNMSIKDKFISSGETKAIYKLINPRFKNKTLVLALKLENEQYIYVTSSLEPLGSITKIFARQLIYVTIIVLVLSFGVGYIISKKLASPILKINKEAGNLAKNTNPHFETNSDIKEINELSNTLNIVSDELFKTEELRRELMANVSHDLKTPLTMIKAYAEMVRDLTYDNKEKRDKNLNTIIDETDRLNILVNDILELSKMQSNIVKLNYEDFDLSLLIRDVINRYDIYIQNKICNFELNLDDNCIINADKKRIEQVMYNLINNAINYSSKKVIINVYKFDNYFRVEVCDDGNGIDEKNIKLIWDKYYKVDKSYKRENIGTGLGLSIVKNIFIKHKFRYGVESQVDVGTTFWFEIDKVTH